MHADHVAENTRMWNEAAPEWVESGERNWRSEPSWGQWGVPEAEVGMLPDRLEEMEVIELGCGTGYVAGWMGRRGARVTGVDVSRGQLDTARRLAEEHGAEVRFLEANAEEVPLEDGSFDFAISEYGAALWAEPRAWLAEAHRLLRPAGRLHFLSSTPMAAVCSPLDGSTPVGVILTRPYFDLYRLDWTQVEVNPGGIEFVPTISEWFRVFREVGFAIDDYLELQAPPDAAGTPFTVPAEWARRWPSEHVWKLTRVP